MSGGVTGAEAGTLTFMVGGSKENFEAAQVGFNSIHAVILFWQDVLSCMGKNKIYCGDAGSGGKMMFK